ncbi:MAG: FAD-binding oxidoreductase [Candidatus Caldarchaeum sp.]
MPDIDVVVVGGGILGLASAYYIKSLHRELSVTVIERGRDVGQGNTARSVGGYRQGIFTSYVNRVLAETTIQHLREAEASGETSLNMREVGYLILLDENRLKNVKTVVETFLKEGKAVLLSPETLSKTLHMRTDFTGDEEAMLMGLSNIKAGLFAPRCGFLDVEKVVNLYKKRCIEAGVELILGKRVEKLLLEPENPLGIPREPRAWQKVRVAGVVVDGEVIRAGKVVVATGSWTPQLLDPLGVDCFVKAKKRQLFVVSAEGELHKLLTNTWDGGRPMPMMFFPNGLYIVPRISDKAFWVSLTDEFGRGFGLDDEPEPSYYIDNVYPPLVKYYPQFLNARASSMWAGTYSMNYLDGNPLIFRFLNCLVVTGASGSGVMKSDAIGRIAEAALFGKEYAILHGGVKFEVSRLGVENRRVDKEYFIL